VEGRKVPGDPFKAVTAGERFRPQARTWNALMDLARGQVAVPSGEPMPVDRAGLVLVQNGSGEDLERYGVLGISGLVFDADDDLDAFHSNSALTGVKPTAAHRGLFVVVVEPIAVTDCGYARMAGATPVLVNVVDEGDAYADVEDVAAYACKRLKSGVRGVARILWKQEGTGEKWAYVHFPVASPTVLGGKVVGVRGLDDDEWPGFEDAQEFISHLVVQSCPLGGGTAGEEEFYVKATANPAAAHIGYKDIAVADVIGWTPTWSVEQVPGAAVGTYFYGYLVEHAGLNGATQTAVLLT
jgi:hypothetical protein